ncbi:hypothetical protein KUCAC02_029730 [Chaenocephalus aceratus]|nr:hypothetical protein KUCAC02_029730 [Chaenocephalus aceratus]
MDTKGSSWSKQTSGQLILRRIPAAPGSSPGSASFSPLRTTMDRHYKWTAVLLPDPAGHASSCAGPQPPPPRVAPHLAPQVQLPLDLTLLLLAPPSGWSATPPPAPTLAPQLAPPLSRSGRRT